MPAPAPILCPSSRCQPGAILLGIVLSDGSVAFAKDRIAVDGAFVENARQGRAPESRFRFSTPCASSGCQQWTGNRCGVIDSVLDQVGRTGLADSLPECSIRGQCRWFDQSGSRACSICDRIVTETRPPVGVS